MSYHVQQNTQQKSLGIFIVIAFHVLLIWGLVSGLGVKIATILTPEAITLAPHKQEPVTKQNIDPQEVIIPTHKTITLDPVERKTLTFDDKVVVDEGKIIGDGGVIERAVMTKPRLIHATKPDYPIAASRLGEEGTTGLSLYVTADGHVGEAKLFSTSGSTSLDNAAIKHALRNWAFTPCMEGDKAVACWHQTKLVWRLEDAKR